MIRGKETVLRAHASANANANAKNNETAETGDTMEAAE